jgi:hypothetical protein
MVVEVVEDVVVEVSAEEAFNLKKLKLIIFYFAHKTRDVRYSV